MGSNRAKKRRFGKRDAAAQAIGYANFDAYMKSSLWKGIKGMVIQNAKTCSMCANARPTEAWHLDHDRATLLGKRLSGLIGICRSCYDRSRNPKNKTCSPQAPPQRYIPEISEDCRSAILEGLLANPRF